MSIKKTFGEKIKRLRKKRGLTQEQFAEMIDIAPRNLCKIEIGDSFVKAETLERIIDALGITLDELFSMDHIKGNRELLSDIYSLLDDIKDDTRQLEKIYKMIRFLTE